MNARRICRKTVYTQDSHFLMDDLTVEFYLSAAAVNIKTVLCSTQDFYSLWVAFRVELKKKLSDFRCNRIIQRLGVIYDHGKKHRISCSDSL